jgi:hypothetical protein
MTAKCAAPWLVGLALVSSASGAPADGISVAPAPSPSDFRAVRLDGASVHLDGVPDEDVWQQASVITGLTSFDPIEGEAPAGTLRARIFYDDHALYVAARIELPPGAMRGRLASRERWNNDDLFELMIDPFLDRRTGYDFTVNPYGVQLDWTIVDDDWSSAWDGVWDSATQRYDDGFSVEMRIPFRTLRFSGKTLQDWGIGIGFYSGMKKQYDKWPAMSADRGTVFAQLGVMRGISGVQPSHNLELLPTLMTGHGGADTDGDFTWDDPTLMRARDPGLVDIGLDVRYGITSATNLNLTLNPDFSQVEADPDQLEYNLRFPLFLAEKRPFFLEGIGIFATPVPLLYTRSIVDPIAGLKLSGRDGAWSFGLLSAYDQLPLGSQLAESGRRSGFEELTGKDAVNTIGRASFDLGGGSRVGLFIADKALRARDTGGYAGRNDVVAGDAVLTFADIYTIIAQLASSYTDRPAADAPGMNGEALNGDAFSGLFYRLTARRRDKNLLLELRSEYYSDGFRAETSPLTRVNVIPSGAVGTYRFYTGAEAVPFVEPGVTLSSVHAPSSFALLDYAIAPSVATRLGKNTDLSLSYSRGQETFVNRFAGIDVVGAELTTYPWNFLAASMELQVGDQINYDSMDPFLGSAVQGSVGAMVNPIKNAELELKYTKSRLSRPDGTRAADVDLYYGKLSVSFTTRLSLRLISQLDTYKDKLLNSALFSYQLYPGTEAYLGYQESDVVVGDARPLDRRAFLKLSYRWQL